MKLPPIVSPQEWKTAHQELLVEEKALTRARDAMAAKRRRMPWMAVDKDYRFEGPTGPASLADLFEGRRQLIVYRAFYAPDVTTYPQSGGSYPQRACVGCSLGADQVAHPAHLNARDTTLAYVSRAPQAEIQGLKERMGWETIPWYTVTDDFDVDFGVDQWHGTNAFIRDGDRIFRTYFVQDRGTSSWAAPGATSTSLRSDAKRRGRTRPRATRRRRPTSGGTTTTPTARAADHAPTSRQAPRACRAAVAARRRYRSSLSPLGDMPCDQQPREQQVYCRCRCSHAPTPTALSVTAGPGTRASSSRMAAHLPTQTEQMHNP